MIIMLTYTDNNNRDNIFFQQAVSKDYFPCFVQIIIIIHQVFLQCAIVIKHKFACEITLRGRKMLLKERKNYKLLFEVN